MLSWSSNHDGNSNPANITREWNCPLSIFSRVTWKPKRLISSRLYEIVLFLSITAPLVGICARQHNHRHCFQTAGSLHRFDTALRTSPRTILNNNDQQSMFTRRTKIIHCHCIFSYHCVQNNVHGDVSSGCVYAYIPLCAHCCTLYSIH